MPAPAKISFDEICSKRQFSVRTGPNGGDMLTKLTFRAPRSWDKDARSARFVMSKEIPDRYGDIVVAKGIKLDDFTKNPVVLWAHNSRNAPIGMWSDVAVAGKGLEGTANFAPEGKNEEADKVASLVEASLLRACSIGFMPLEWEVIDKDKPWGGWKFIESDLWECSICSVPANPAALVKAAGGDMGAALQAIELVLDEWTRTPAGTIVPRAAFEKAYNVVRRDDAPTLVEVKSIDEDADDFELDVKGADPEASKRLEDLVARGVTTALGLLGFKPKEKAADPVEPPLDTETVVELNIAADEAVATDVADAAAEEKRLAEEKAAAEQAAAAEQEELELRARALAALA